MSNSESNFLLNQLNQEQTSEFFPSDDLFIYNGLFENESQEDNKIELIPGSIDGLAEFENNHEQTCHLFHDIERQYYTTFTTESMWPI
ncbi:hypothetical protein BpHYR1_017651 [Brachionus plicatilis]|uniref:Uncharacterized protein n=1 Tax=Brachionus plicatilis TaxID=10195 RepID=A0A3M7P4E0_BRAPC|nr:hypothetical protein BpHYR1_017651 [Brachionus plicatilis]